MLIPEVIGFKLTGTLPEGATATDLVLTVTQMLRKKGVVGKFVEFYGPGLDHLTLADRATIANMAPEYGATCGFFPVDRDDARLPDAPPAATPERVALVEAYAKAQGMWREPAAADPVFTDTLELDLATVVPSLAGPKRPQDRVLLTDAAAEFADGAGQATSARPTTRRRACRSRARTTTVGHGDVVIAAITSLHQHLQPLGADRRRPGRHARRVAQGPEGASPG